jgi:hypothetical protein
VKQELEMAFTKTLNGSPVALEQNFATIEGTPSRLTEGC